MADFGKLLPNKNVNGTVIFGRVFDEKRFDEMLENQEFESTLKILFENEGILITETDEEWQLSYLCITREGGVIYVIMNVQDGCGEILHDVFMDDDGTFRMDSNAVERIYASNYDSLEGYIINGSTMLMWAMAYNDAADEGAKLAAIFGFNGHRW